MYNEVVISKLYTCLEHIDTINRYFKDVQNSQHFFNMNGGVQYDATLMRLQALGENLKRISQKHSFVIDDLKYGDIDNVIRLRDYVSHHYEQLEHEVVYDICHNKIPELKNCLNVLIEKHKID